MRFYLVDSLIDTPSSSSTFLISTTPSEPGTAQPLQLRIENRQDQHVYRDVHLSRRSFRRWLNRSAFASREEWPPRVIDDHLSRNAALDDVSDEEEESAVSSEEEESTVNFEEEEGEITESIPAIRSHSSSSTTSSSSTAPSMTDIEQPPPRPSILERVRQLWADHPPVPHNESNIIRRAMHEGFIERLESRLRPALPTQNDTVEAESVSSSSSPTSTTPSSRDVEQPLRSHVEEVARRIGTNAADRFLFGHIARPHQLAGEVEEEEERTDSDETDEEEESAMSSDDEETEEEPEEVSSNSSTTALPMPDTEQASPPSVAERAQLILAELPDFPTIGGAMVARIYLLGLVRRLHQPDQESLHHSHMNRMFPSHPRVEVGPASGSSGDALDERADSAVNSGEDESNESGDEEMGRARTRRRASAEEGEGEAEEEELDTRARSPSSPPTVPSMTAPSTTIIGGLRRIPLVEALTRDAAMMYHFRRYSAALSMWRTRRAMREGNEPLRTVLSAPVAVSWKHMAEEELTQIGAKKSKKNDEEEVESDEEDVISSAEDETSGAEVEKQVTSSARERRRPFAQMKELLLRYRAVMTPLPPSLPPSIPSSPTMCPTSFTTSSISSTTTPAKPPLDEVVLRHILTNIDTFHKHPAEEMIRTAIDSLMERGEHRLVHALLDEALRAGIRPVDDVWSEEEEERESVGGKETSISADGDAENDKEASESGEEAADELPDNVCLPAEENANPRKTRLDAVGALPSGWNASLLIRPRFFAGKAPAGNRNGNAINGVGRRRIGKYGLVIDLVSWSCEVQAGRREIRWGVSMIGMEM